MKTLFTLLLLTLIFAQARATQVEINGPTGSVAFGSQVVVLPNGNIVVTDPNYSEGGVTNIGAAYLYDGATLALISTLKGSTMNDRIGAGAITVLANGNFVVPNGSWDNGAAMDAGAVTFCNATTGCNGLVSPANSLVGSTVGDFVGNVTALPNGNYFVSSVDWDKILPPTRADVGAVTFCNGTSGCTGTITQSNSFIGSAANDRVGSNGLTILANGNFVVNSPLLDSGVFTDVGAVTFCSGTSGCAGVVGSANSLVGEKNSDRVGTSPGSPGSNGVVALSNGNYVVASAFWNPNSISNPNPFGAVTLCNGTTGCAGTVNINNDSLTGSTNGMSVGINGVTALPNGNYVVNSPNWDGAMTDVGAVTFCNGITGCGSEINSSNSLTGATAFDNIGNAGTPAQLLNPITVLADGNYVVESRAWDNGATADVGAVTWCSGTTGCAGVVSPANSLIGSTVNDQAGSFSFFTRGVYALKNGNYVVNSPFWNNPSPAMADVGAVTFCNGAANSCANTVVSQTNSVIGSKASDLLGIDGTTVLTNSNYVTESSSWDNGAAVDVGAITFCNGTTGCTGAVSSANSLIGSRANDFLPHKIITFPNGNYVVSNPNWDNGAAVTNAGAITLCNGTTGRTGSISASNSLVGSIANDQIGSTVVAVLTNGNYVVNSPNWDNGAITDAGAVTFCNGTTGCVGVVAASNSLVGSQAFDQVGSLTKLLNGNYIVKSSSWDNGATTNAGAVTFGDGSSGTINAITSANSILGTIANNGSLLSFAFDESLNRLFVGRSASTVSILFFETIAVADGELSNSATWSGGVPNALTNIIIPAGRTVTVNSNATIGSLSIANGANLVMNANLKLTGNLTLGTQINTGANALALSCSSSVSGASLSNYVIGNLEKNFCAAGAFSYPTGTTSGYSPVNVIVTALGVNPSSLTIKAVQGPQPNQNPTLCLQRYWTLAEAGDLTADLTFNYLQGDVMGNESGYQLFKVVGGVTQRFPHNPPSVVIDTIANTAFIGGVRSFSDWTLGEPVAPTASNGNVSGRILDDQGNPVEGAVIRLSGTQNRKTITDSNGNYNFFDVETNGFYTVTPSRVNFSFSPSQRAFSQLGNHTDAAFSASPTGNSLNPLDTSEYFVRQQFLDFLNREPDEAGFNFWANNIESCGADGNCREIKRTDTSAAFFLSTEFRETGYLVYRIYQAAYGYLPGAPVPLRRGEFNPDAQEISRGVVVLQSGWETVLENNKQAFTAGFVQRTRFTTAFPTTLTPAQFVDMLFANAGVMPSSTDRNAAIGEFGAATNTTDTAARGRALRRVAENSTLNQQEFNRTFVLMQYLGYLRRNPNDPQDTDYSGYDFWLTKLNQFNGNFQNAEMVKAFITSSEYRRRFGP